MSLVSLYAWPMIASMLAAIALTLLGIQLAARDRSTQILCSSQGAMVGTLLGIGIFHAQDWHAAEEQLPLFFAFVFSAGVYLYSERLANLQVASRNTLILSMFGALLALGHLVSSLFPSIETHLAQVYFGDLAVLSNINAQVISGISIVCTLLMVFYWSSISLRSFHCAVFGEQGSKLDTALALLLISSSVQMMGVLFTLGLLLLPTALFTRGVGSFKSHTWLSLLTALISTVVGFLLSLWLTRLPTVPAIIACVVLLGIAIKKVGLLWIRSKVG